MSAEGPHSKLIAERAREILGAAGLARQGRSRIWLDDQGYWVGVIEFQPSSWSKGSYLNVAACFLWAHRIGDHYLSFDAHPQSKTHARVEGFTEYESDAQFRPVADELSRSALESVVELRATYSPPDRGFRRVTKDAKGAKPGDWRTFRAGIAFGLIGNQRRAHKHLTRFADAVGRGREPRPDWTLGAERRARQLADLVQAADGSFRLEVETSIRAFRAGLGLDPHQFDLMASGE